MITVSASFNPHDLWVGVYWRTVRLLPGPLEVGRPFPPMTKYRRHLDVYICLVPCFPIKVEWTGCERGLYDHKPLHKRDSAQDINVQ